MNHEPSSPGLDAVWWPRVREQANQPPPTSRVELLLGEQVIGSIAEPVADALLLASLPLCQDTHRNQVRLVGDPDVALASIAAWLRASGQAGPWRNELLAVRPTTGNDARPVARVERGVARNLGIATVAVHLHAREATSQRWWLQLRSLDKATDPGKWDTLMGGMVSAGESMEQALARESWEEAGVDLSALADAPTVAGSFTVRRPVTDQGDHGYAIETVAAFCCELATNQIPVNQDGEVLRFQTHSDREIDTLIASGQLTLEAAITVALCRGVLA